MKALQYLVWALMLLAVLNVALCNEDEDESSGDSKKKNGTCLTPTSKPRGTATFSFCALVFSQQQQRGGSSVLVVCFLLF